MHLLHVNVTKDNVIMCICVILSEVTLMLQVGAILTIRPTECAENATFKKGASKD